MTRVEDTWSRMYGGGLFRALLCSVLVVNCLFIEVSLAADSRKQGSLRPQLKRNRPQARNPSPSEDFEVIELQAFKGTLGAGLRELWQRHLDDDPLARFAAEIVRTHVDNRLERTRDELGMGIMAPETVPMELIHYGLYSVLNRCHDQWGSKMCCRSLVTANELGAEFWTTHIGAIMKYVADGVIRKEDAIRGLGAILKEAIETRSDEVLTAIASSFGVPVECILEPPSSPVGVVSLSPSDTMEVDREMYGGNGFVATENTGFISTLQQQPLETTTCSPMDISESSRFYSDLDLTETTTFQKCMQRADEWEAVLHRQKAASPQLLLDTSLALWKLGSLRQNLNGRRPDSVSYATWKWWHQYIFETKW